MKLIIAPHEIHREHLMYIESLLKRPSVRLSDVMQDKSLLEGKDCLIVDSFGLLSSIYRYGTIAYIAGSLQDLCIGQQLIHLGHELIF